MNRAKRRKHSLLLLTTLGIGLLLLGCGRKGAPVPPNVIIPPPVGDLKAQVMGNEVRLTWSTPQGENSGSRQGIREYEVFRHRAHKSVVPCPGCPVSFEHYLDIEHHAPYPAYIEDGRVVFHDRIDSRYRYAYKVVVHHKSGGESNDSNTVHVTTEE